MQARAAYPFADPYFGGIVAAYGAQAVVITLNAMHQFARLFGWWLTAVIRVTNPKFQCYWYILRLLILLVGIDSPPHVGGSTSTNAPPI